MYDTTCGVSHRSGLRLSVDDVTRHGCNGFCYMGWRTMVQKSLQCSHDFALLSWYGNGWLASYVVSSTSKYAFACPCEVSAPYAAHYIAEMVSCSSPTPGPQPNRLPQSQSIFTPQANQHPPLHHTAQSHPALAPSSQPHPAPLSPALPPNASHVPAEPPKRATQRSRGAATGPQVQPSTRPPARRLADVPPATVPSLEHVR